MTRLMSTGPSREELEGLDREVRPAPWSTQQHQRYLFRLLRHCIRWSEGPSPTPTLVQDPIATIIFHTLWRMNAGLAKHGAKVHGPPGFSFDAVQDAHFGLRKGLLRFDPERGTMPSTYLMWWIRHAVMRSLSDSHSGVISLQANARRQIKDGKVERPIVFSYHGFAQRRGLDEPEQLAFMTDTEAVSVESRIEIHQLFTEWREKLARAAAVAERESQVDYLLFTLETGYGRFPKGPVRMKALKRLTHLKEHKIKRRTEKVLKRIGRACGIRDQATMRRLIEAMVEFSLSYGIPL